MASPNNTTVHVPITRNPVTSNLITMGKKYQTRDGRAVRILCVDGPGNLCVYGIVTKAGSDFINPMRWEKNGRFSWSGYCPENDLIPVPTKHEGWVVLTAIAQAMGFISHEEAQEVAAKQTGSVVAHVTWET